MKEMGSWVRIPAGSQKQIQKESQTARTTHKKQGYDAAHSNAKATEKGLDASDIRQDTGHEGSGGPAKK